LVLSLLCDYQEKPGTQRDVDAAAFFHIAGLYLFLNAEFIAAIQVIVYAGAILVLFLFVVLLLNCGGDCPSADRRLMAGRFFHISPSVRCRDSRARRICSGACRQVLD